MIRTPITGEDMKVLREERFTHPHPRVQRKMEAVYLTGMGLLRHEVARLLATSEEAVKRADECPYAAKEGVRNRVVLAA